MVARKRQRGDDFFIQSDSSGDEGASISEEEVDPHANEAPHERRVRLAKEYLERIDKRAREESSDDEGEDEFDDSDKTHTRLRREAFKARGVLRTSLAAPLITEGIDDSSIVELKGHRLSPTCVAMSPDDLTVYSGAKDGSWIRWDVATGRKTLRRPSVPKSQRESGHISHILGMDVSSDGRFLVTAGRDKMICLWDTRSGDFIKRFEHHKDIVTSIAFQKVEPPNDKAYQFYSASYDRTVKIWDAADTTYVDSLFGHQGPVIALDALNQERALSVGEDKSMRLWKVEEESQLVFRGGSASIDAGCMITESFFLSGDADGTLMLWNVAKKKPIQQIRNAHCGAGIVSIATRPFSDLAASGSSDGFIRLWMINREQRGIKSIEHILSFPMPGYVNAIAFASTRPLLIAAVGKEPRLGRWNKIPEARNSVYIIRLPSKAKPRIVGNEFDD